MNVPDWRREGREPDYRFSLANERTFLAWVRTALAVLAGALVLDQFAVRHEPRWMLSTLTVVLAVLAALLSLGAYARWKANEVAMRLERPLPHSVGLSLLSAGAMIAAAVVALLQFLR